ncbi:MAG: sensor histidine kinase [Candidatus Xenobia bacterium]
MSARLRDSSAQELARLKTLAAISQMIGEPRDRDVTLRQIMDTVMQAIEAERGFVLLDRGGRTPEVVARAGVPADVLSDAGFEFSRSVVEGVLHGGQSVLCHDAPNDPRFAASSSLRMLGTRSILCVPIVRPPATPSGVIYVDSRTTTDIFSEVDRELLEIIARFACNALERARETSLLIQSEKMATLGMLVAGLAHELNNPLTTVIGVAQLLAEQQPSSESREMADLIYRESMRCHDLVAELLRAAQRARVTMETVDTADVLHRAIRLMSARLHDAGIALHAEVGAELPRIRGNAQQLLQVMLNLITNAYQAVLAQRGEVRVAAFRSSRGVRIQVADNGPRIDPGKLRHVFEPFSTARGGDEGSGLSLIMAQRIVLDHGGTLVVENAERGGVVFTVELPRVRLEFSK